MDTVKRQYTMHRLFAKPSFIGGTASLLDLGNTLREYNASVTGEEADFKALQDDWRAVGDDMKTSIKQYERRISESTK